MSLPMTPPARTNATPLFDLHPADHNYIVTAINEVNAELTLALGDANYRVYPTVEDRDADTSAHVEGMLSWVISQRQLSVWHGEWEVFFMPYTPFTPQCFIGENELAPIGPPPAYQSGYRLSYGVVEFSVAHRYGVLKDPPEQNDDDILFVVPPIPPDGQGGFGNAYVADPDLGVVGGIGGAFNVDQLAIVMPGAVLPGLMTRLELGNSGNEIEVFMNGFYTTSTYADVPITVVVPP